VKIFGQSFSWSNFTPSRKAEAMAGIGLLAQIKAGIGCVMLVVSLPLALTFFTSAIMLCLMSGAVRLLPAYRSIGAKRFSRTGFARTRSRSYSSSSRSVSFSDEEAESDEPP